MRMIKLRRVLLATGAIGLALFVGACGDDSGGMDHGNMGGATSAAPPSGATFNAADVKFATEMIQHHRQALEMSKLAESRAVTPEVKALAAKISKAQEPEIATMSAWLTAWGQPVPSAGGMDHGAGSMPGMMTDQEMQQLTQASGTEFDKMFLEMMIKHHQGAVEMAKTQQAQGTDAAAKKLAGEIITAQNAEISEMQGLLTKL